MECQVCGAESVHHLQFVDDVQIPLCRPHLFRLFRRFKPGDKELMRFRCREIADGWKVTRKHKYRSKVTSEMLEQITELRCNGYSMTVISQKLGIAKSLVHRYVTKLQDVTRG